eukprot:GHVS01031236.1.p1 GENE.GHVS01031236.1~~GHVS01031236.1.p1  ORF type:complete len:150 (+),score=4.54 GHVS01031236.1:138-587(+)
MSAAVEESCEKIKCDYRTCLANSGRNLSKCLAEESQLRACSKNLNRSYCIDEGVSLMNCIRNGSDRNSCSSEFLKMRECNRPGGPQIVIEDANYVIANNKTNTKRYGICDGSSRTICSTSAPSPSSSELQIMLSDRNNALHVRQHITEK